MDYRYAARNKKDYSQYGVITEQGDLGLGFDVLNESDQKVVNEVFKHKDSEKNDK